MLKANRVSAQQSDVVALTCNSTAAEFAEQMDYFTREGLSVEYMYCFSTGEKAFLILRTSDNAMVDAIARKYGLDIITEKELLSV